MTQVHQTATRQSVVRRMAAFLKNSTYDMLPAGGDAELFLDSEIKFSSLSFQSSCRFILAICRKTVTASGICPFFKSHLGLSGRNLRQNILNLRNIDFKEDKFCNKCYGNIAKIAKYGIAVTR